MKITIKSLHSNPSLSEETLCFSCMVCVGGKKAFNASNRGTGGCHEYHPVAGQTGEVVQKAEAWAKEQFPGEMEPLDLLIDNLIERESVRKMLVREFKTKLLIHYPDGKLKEVSLKGVPEEVDRLKETIRLGCGVILNDMPLADAVEIYLENNNEQQTNNRQVSPAGVGERQRNIG